MSSIGKQFRVSSALKNIIGRELINDDLIAVFELVKNAFDAGAHRVDIEFKNTHSTSPTLIIKDNGKGMDKNDLENKWLFVAYSAKRDGVEDDYRDKIRPTRIYAGAKGIGRFSCDRLGEKLRIFTRKAQNKRLCLLEVDWNDFEENSKNLFETIDVLYSITSANPYKIKRGTTLEISGLRENWDRDKLLKLKRSLEKLINPNQGNDSKGFAIYLKVPDELPNDRNLPKDESWGKINGKIENFLFENLKLKTTQIKSSISPDGRTITTRLEDRGALIYEIKESNEYEVQEKPLHDINVHLFALNQAAKTHFAKHMGLRVVSYGSISLYKNGFRIYPFGELGDDSLGVDGRKQQYGSRVLGTRDLIGRIEINGENKEFYETSSRDGGLVKNASVEQLLKFVQDSALSRLEKFTINVIKFGIDDKPLTPGENIKGEVKENLFELVKNLSDPNSLLDVKYGDGILEAVSQAKEKSLRTFLSNFEKLAINTNNNKLIVDVKRARKRIKEFEQYAKDKARKEQLARKEAEAELKVVEKSYNEVKKQNLYFKSTISDEQAVNIGLVHHIKLTSEKLTARVNSLYRDISQDKYDKAKTLKYLAQMQLQTDKILKLSEIASKADLNFKYAKQKADLPRFAYEYINELSTVMSEIVIDIKFSECSLVKEFSALEIMLVIDNLISNSIKAKASKMLFEIEVESKIMILKCHDNGVGISEDIQKRIYEPGFTTRRGGSGIGLYTVKQILSEMGGNIHYIKQGKAMKGTTFKLRF